MKLQKKDIIHPEFAKNFGKGQNWIPGIVIDIVSPKSFLVQIKEVVWKRHTDQIKPRLLPETNMNLQEEQLGQKKILRQASLDTFHGERNADMRVMRKPSQTSCLDLEKRRQESIQNRQERDTTRDLERSEIEEVGRRIERKEIEEIGRTVRDEEIERRTSGRVSRKPRRLIEEKV